MFILGVTKNRIHLLSVCGGFCYCQSGFMGVVVYGYYCAGLSSHCTDIFSVQASNIKEYFEYLDLSWKLMISRTHLKEVHALLV